VFVFSLNAALICWPRSLSAQHPGDVAGPNGPVARSATLQPALFRRNCSFLFIRV